MLKFVARAVGTAGDLVAPPLMSFGHLPLWGTALLFTLVAWLPALYEAIANVEVTWPQRLAQIFSGALLCLPIVSLLISIFVAQRAALYIGVAEALLDETNRAA